MSIKRFDCSASVGHDRMREMMLDPEVPLAALQRALSCTPGSSTHSNFVVSKHKSSSDAILVRNARLPNSVITIGAVRLYG
jgi:hypothetical protein